MSRRLLSFLLVVGAMLSVLAGCQVAPDERAKNDRRVGKANNDQGTITVAEGLAAVRRFDGTDVELWAQAPSLDLSLVSKPDAASTWTLTILNVLPDADLTAVAEDGSALTVTEQEPPRRTGRVWMFELPPGTQAQLSLAASGAWTAAPFRFAVLSDIQDGIGQFQDMVVKLNAEPDLRFVLSSGDLVENGDRALLERFQRELETLDIPWYSTVGNHEFIQGDAKDWFELFGRASFHFEFQGVHFSFVDSGSGTVDPTVYDWLAEWLERGAGSLHVVVTHIPPLDPFGLRSGSFNSRAEAASFIKRLADGGVDVTFYGHLHSYYAYSNGGIPAFISGGGGAIPEKLDGIGRHFLVVEAEPTSQRLDVVLRRVD